jgi:hypothetical protein
MSMESSRFLAVSLLTAGAAWAGTVQVDYMTLTSSGPTNPSGFTRSPTQLTLTTVDTDRPSAPTWWQRDRWESDDDSTRVVQLDMGLLQSGVPGTAWADSCIQNRNLDGTTLYDKVESVNASRWWVDAVATDARAAFTAAGRDPGSPTTKYASVGAVRSVRSKSAAPTSEIAIPPVLGFPVEFSFLTGGLRKAAVAGTTADYTIVMTFGAGGGARTRTFRTSIKDATVGSTARNGPSGTFVTTLPSEAGAASVSYRKYNWTLPAPGTTNNAGCLSTYVNGDEVVIDNPGLTDPALAGLALTAVSFSFTELDPTASSPTAYLPGPTSVALTVDADDYDEAYRYRESGGSPSGGATVIKANAGAPSAWWFAAEYDVTWPTNDSFSDIFLEMRCGFDSGGAVSFTGSTMLDLTPTGLRDLQGASGAGVIEFDTSACFGEYAQVFVEMVSAFDSTPILHDFDLVYDIDDDYDDKTVEGIYDPITMVAGPATRVVNTADVHDDTFTWPSVATRIDCDDTNSTVNAARNYYTDADGDGDGTGAPTALCPAAAAGRAPNNLDCKDTGAGANTYNASNSNGLRGTELPGNGQDYNCDGSVTCFRDNDGDGDGSTTTVTRTGVTGGGSATICINSVVGGTANDSVDCNDNSDDFSFQAQPGRATETPTDGNDYNCDGSVACHLDADGDGIGTTTTVPVSVNPGGHANCTAPGRATVSTDCEDDVADGGANIFPGAAETTGSGQDRNCSGTIVCYQDNDLDGDGDENPATSTVSITVTAGTTVSCVRSAAQNAGATPASKPTSGNNLDCKDTGASANTYSTSNSNGLRGTETTGGGLDFNCDDSVLCFVDNDGDGDGASTTVAKAVTGGGTATSCVNAVPGGTSNDTGDCNDNSTSFRPNGAPAETPANGNDFNCDGSVSCFVDADGDDFGTTTALPVSVTAGGLVDCTATGRAVVSTDCEDDVVDSGALFFPGAAETAGVGADRNCSASVECFVDNDADGDGDENPATATASITVTSGAVISCARTAAQNASGSTVPNKATSANATDCNDASNTFSFTAQGSRLSETAGNGNDYNCDGEVVCFRDEDQDGHGGAPTSVPVGAETFVNCSDPLGRLADQARDCDDTSAAHHPGAVEIVGSGEDFDCDGLLTCFVDDDGDGHGVEAEVSFRPPQGGPTSCVGPGRSDRADDCDDGDELTSPNAPELTGLGVDRNCDGQVVCHADGDRDGYGATGMEVTLAVDAQGSGYLGLCDRLGPAVDDPTSSIEGDCNDEDSRFHPSVAEPAGGVDLNCDGEVSCWLDMDQDGQGGTAEDPIPLANLVMPGETFSCNLPDFYLADNGLDCDDMEPATWSGAPEDLGDGVDRDCDGAILCYQDVDGDGWGGPDFVPVTVATPGGAGDCVVAGTSARGGDCNDLEDPSGEFNPGVMGEVAGSGVDHDCDGVVICFADRDGDGEGARNSELVEVPVAHGGSTSCLRDASQNALAAPPGLSTAELATDCDDTSASYSLAQQPSRPAESPGEGQDYDCDGEVRCFIDEDGDSWGTDLVLVEVSQGYRAGCDLPAEALSSRGEDCNDAVDGGALHHPGRMGDEAAGEGVDLDCDGRVTCFADDDGDGVGTEVPTEVIVDVGGATLCGGVGHSALSTDCDDGPAGASLYPGATEPDGGGIDLDCDGAVICWEDVDRDGEGDRGRPARREVGARGGGSAGFCDRREGPTPTSSNDADCDDSDATFRSAIPDAEEPVDGADHNCDGDVRCWPDVDGDTWGDSAQGAVPITVPDAVPPGGTARCDFPLLAIAAEQGDCQDNDPAIYVGAPEVVGGEVDHNCDGSVACYIDADGDSWGRDQQASASVTPRGGRLVCASLGGAVRSGDCNDDVASGREFYPGSGAEAAGGVEVDYSCDGTVHCFLDADGDGHGTDSLVDLSGLPLGGAAECLAAEGRSDHVSDCDDSDAAVHEGAAEPIGVGQDLDCDGLVRCYADADGDGFGRGDALIDVPAGAVGAAASCAPFGAARDGDCLDCMTVIDGVCMDGPTSLAIAAGVNPDQQEQLDDGPLDEDCDGAVACFADRDGDGWGDRAISVDDPLTWAISPVAAVGGRGECPRDQGLVAGDPNATDCDDGDATVHPEAAEGIADGADQDCDGRELCYADEDRDDFSAGLTHTSTDLACANPDDEAEAPGEGSTDCDDANADVHPGAAVIYNNKIDEDCSGTIEECLKDLDGDGYGSVPTRGTTDRCGSEGTVVATGELDCNDGNETINPGSSDLPGDGIDQNCDKEGVGCGCHTGARAGHLTLLWIMLAVGRRKRQPA